MSRAEPAPRQHQRHDIRPVDQSGDTGRHRHAFAGAIAARRSARCREGRSRPRLRLVSGQRQASPWVRREHLQFDRIHLSLFGRDRVPRASASAIRSTSLSPTSRLRHFRPVLDASAETRCTRFSSPPMIPVAGDTSLATIQSPPFRCSFADALARRFSVSAAKPMRSRGRFGWRGEAGQDVRVLDEGERGGTAALLLELLGASSTRQSATAAAMTAMSAGSAASTAACISRAVVDLHDRTPGGAIATGPLTSVTSAPAAASAAAIACPCRPDERLAR